MGTRLRPIDKVAFGNCLRMFVFAEPLFTNSFDLSERLTKKHLDHLKGCYVRVPTSVRTKIMAFLADFTGLISDGFLRASPIKAICIFV